MSLAESIANVTVGYAIAMVTQIAVFPLFGIRASFADNALLSAVFTIVSLVRSYALRRLFEAMRRR